jgi:hypothetical protein
VNSSGRVGVVVCGNILVL